MDDIYIGYQILGLLIIQSKSLMPQEVYDAIMFSTSWKYDKTRIWAKDYIPYRKRNLQLFRDLILQCNKNKE